MERKMHVYPICVRRVVKEDGEDEYRMISQRTYCHGKDLTEMDFTHPPKSRIAKMFDEMLARQPKGLSDSQVLEYFEKQMSRKGFSVAETHGLELKLIYSYTVRE